MSLVSTLFRFFRNRPAGPETSLAINAGEATLKKHYSERVTGALLDDVVGKFGDGPGPRVPDEAYTYLLFHPRDTLLSLLPEAGTVAEVGVAKGAFSRRILELNHPRILHLIDPWAKQDEEDYAPDPANAPQDIQDERMDKVLKRLKAPIKRGQVVVHREFSGAAAATFEPAAFDWVYIDAMHTYDAVLADLRAFAPLVKADGFLAGHDFSNHAIAKDMNFGVIEAVKAFVEESDWRLLCVTADEYPSYVLARRGANERAGRMEVAILEKFTFIKIKDFLYRNFSQNLHVNKTTRNVNFYLSLD